MAGPTPFGRPPRPNRCGRGRSLSLEYRFAGFRPASLPGSQWSIESRFQYTGKGRPELRCLEFAHFRGACFSPSLFLRVVALRLKPGAYMKGCHEPGSWADLKIGHYNVGRLLFAAVRAVLPAFPDALLLHFFVETRFLELL